MVSVPPPPPQADPSIVTASLARLQSRGPWKAYTAHQRAVFVYAAVIAELRHRGLEPYSEQLLVIAAIVRRTWESALD